MTQMIEHHIDFITNTNKHIVSKRMLSRSSKEEKRKKVGQSHFFTPDIKNYYKDNQNM